MLTPLGAIYSTNITPDRETGIGESTFDDFLNATKHGVRKDNSALYPAMPSPSYGLMTHEDIAAMYAYFMSDVEPVHPTNKAARNCVGTGKREEVSLAYVCHLERKKKKTK